MTSRRRVVLVSLCVLLAAYVTVEIVRARPRTIGTTELGDVRIYPAWFRARGFTYVFSGADGWNAEDESVAGARARAGDTVIGVDTPRLAAYLNRTARGCTYLPGPLEELSRATQHSIDTERLSAPTLLGRGVGAAMVYAAQLQAPALAFDGVVGLDPEPAVPLEAPLCDLPPVPGQAHGQALPARALGRNVPARFLADPYASNAARTFVDALTRAAGNRRVQLHPKGPATLAALYDAALADESRSRAGHALEDLPVVEVPAPHPSYRTFAVLYSGDGGWRDLDRTIAETMATKGLNVVGFDALRYFWTLRSPGRAAADLARVIRDYQQRWHAHDVALIGYSFGAEVLPFLINRLPKDVRASVRSLTLIAPGRNATFEIDPKDWFWAGDSEGPEIAPELRSVAGVRVQCIFGAEEQADSLCTLPALPAVEVIRRPGGHHFDGDYTSIADRILAGIDPPGGVR